jgi:two-component system response regulator RegA
MRPIRSIDCVLLVDDREDQLAIWARELSGDGRVAHMATSTREALTLARTHRPQVALVDLFLGAEDGLDCVRELKASVPDLFAVVVSSDLSVAYAMAAVRAGAEDVLVKPVVASHVVRRIERGEVGDAERVPQRKALTLQEVEWEHISRALLESNRNITQAAQRLGIYRQTLQRKLRKRGRERAGTG